MKKTLFILALLIFLVGCNGETVKEIDPAKEENIYVDGNYGPELDVKVNELAEPLNKLFQDKLSKVFKFDSLKITLHDYTLDEYKFDEETQNKLNFGKHETILSMNFSVENISNNKMELKHLLGSLNTNLNGDVELYIYPTNLDNLKSEDSGLTVVELNQNERIDLYAYTLLTSTPIDELKYFEVKFPADFISGNDEPITFKIELE